MEKDFLIENQMKNIYILTVMMELNKDNFKQLTMDID